MSHHYSGPNFGFPNGDARLNFADLYAFPNPADPGKTILMMNVHPSASLQPKGTTTSVPFSTTALYELMIDTDGDNVADLAYSARFATSGKGQTGTVRRIEGKQSNRSGNDGTIVIIAAPVSMGKTPAVTTADGYRFFAGWRSDPFFFDTYGAIKLKFTGQDYFTDKDICSIVLEVPNARFGSANLNLWGRVVDGSSGSWVQVDRSAHASQEPFLAGDEKAAYLVGEPAQDARYVPVFAHSLEHAGGYTPEAATQIASTQLLPDVMPYQPGKPATYPSNGRALTDNARGHFLLILTNGKTDGGGLKPHTDLLSEFPYVGPPHHEWSSA